MAAVVVNSDGFETIEFERQKNEIKQLLDTQLVEGDAWYTYPLQCYTRFYLFRCVTVQ